MAPYSAHQSITPIRHGSVTRSPVDRLSREVQRLLCRLEGIGQAIAAALLAASERLGCAVQLDARQSAELLAARQIVAQIVSAGSPQSANLARCALTHLARADEPDRVRDQQVSACLLLVGAARRGAAALGRTIERATVGRARPEGGVTS